VLRMLLRVVVMKRLTLLRPVECIELICGEHGQSRHLFGRFWLVKRGRKWKRSSRSRGGSSSSSSSVGA